MADLITLSEYKALLGIDPTDTRRDAQINVLIPAASRSVINFTDRAFDEIAGSVAAVRSFEYDGSGFLDIDDCKTITRVATDAGTSETYVLSNEEWTAKPEAGEVYYYLLLHGTRFPSSPEMGFARNLDTLSLSRRLPQVYVTAIWGWPSVPADVKLATAWIVEDSMQSPESGLTAESIEGFSRAWGQSRMLAVPNRARDLLANYARPY